MPHPSVTYLLSVTAAVGQLRIKHQNLSFHREFKSEGPFVYVVSYFFAGRLPLSRSEGGQRVSRERRGQGGLRGAEGGGGGAAV